MESNLDSRTLRQVSVLKKIQLYKQSGWKKAAFLKRNFNDYQEHFFAFLIDLNICLLPVYIWAVEFLLILTGIISPMFFDILFYVMYAFLFIASCVALPLYTASTRGQSFGLQYLDLRLVKRNRRLAMPMRLIWRQLLGFGIPLMLFGYFFSVTGLLVWWAVNGLCVLISPNQQTIFDWVFSLAIVHVPALHIEIEEEEPEEKPEDAKPEPAPVPEPVKEPEPVIEEDTVRISPVDLHVRSSFSDDASADVEEIFKLAKQQGMEVISITDHNCARANAQAIRFAAMYDLQYIPGVEIDAICNDQRLRILGYYIDWTHPFFAENERISLTREKEASIARVHAFEAAVGIKINIDAILSRSRFQTITGHDLTYMVFKNQKTRQKPLIQKYLADAQGDEEKAKLLFEQEYFGPGGLCDVQRYYPPASDVIDAIHEAGGLAILAAWHVDQLSNETLEDLLDAGIDGLEAFMPGLSTDTIAFLLSIAAQEKLFVTAGSDYHGEGKKDNQLGVTGAPDKGINMVRVFTRAVDQTNTQSSAPSLKN